MEKRRNKRKLNAWMDIDLLAEVKKMAEAQNRSLTNMIETILWEAVKKENR